DSASPESIRHEKRAKKIGAASGLERGFSMLDAEFFNDSKMLEIEKGAKELTIPIIKDNRKIVAATNGGLKYPSPLVFNSEWKHEEIHDDVKRFNYPSVSSVKRPENEEDIAFMTVLELGHLIRTKQISSEELVGIFLKRLKRYNQVLEAVITVTEDLAYRQAKQADQLLAQGVDLGPLHGIPYGLKDIIAVPEYKTTWGSTTFKDQVLDIEAWVYKRLKSAGAVLVGKLVTGSLAYDDIWFGGILNFTMDVDMLAHFDTWQRSGQDDEFEAQDQWPTELRRARVIPAVDYIQSQRARGKLIQEVKESFTVDAFVGNATDWEKVCVGNLVGMPVMVVPVGFEKIKDPPTNGTRRRSTVTTGIYAPPDHDHIALALTMAYQSVTNHHKRRPPIDNLGPDDTIRNPPKTVIPPRILKAMVDAS
ncbi:hypothetical protein M8C21_032239, partial [Ambrosia artemisiifolia]